VHLPDFFGVFFMANSPMAVGEGGGDRLVGWVLGDLRQLVVGGMCLYKEVSALIGKHKCGRIFGFSEVESGYSLIKNAPVDNVAAVEMAIDN
jgi:hypothetical protein